MIRTELDLISVLDIQYTDCLNHLVSIESLRPSRMITGVIDL